jgi:hypothetical protein
MERAVVSHKSTDAKKDVAAGYNAFKEFGGRKYTGMRVGRGHIWYYHEGEWKETKITPDKWEFTYAVNKRRKGNAPEGSGVPVGTEYHWYILAHQTVKKLNANDYTTSMTGMKYKLAHRRAGSERWSASERAQSRQLIKIFEESISQLQRTLMGEADKEQDSPPRKESQVTRRTLSYRRKAPLANLPLASR